MVRRYVDSFEFWTMEKMDINLHTLTPPIDLNLNTFLMPFFPVIAVVTVNGTKKETHWPSE